ncbi:MAG: PEP-CTERM sorting domain-containing protein [Planctomycetota bacterium]|nr:MAG: PEP-CTERM sorting domain-containing protein [Planctomycetota bacterium]
MKSKNLNPFLIAIAAGLVVTTSTTHAADGTWNVDANGLWSLNTNWASSIIANDLTSTANFTNNITADRTVSLDTDRTINRVNFSDATTATAGSWILNNNATATNNLILSGTTGAATGTVPVIDVGALGTGKTATISAIIEGSYGFTKTGTGTLVLSGANSNLSGNVTILSGTVDSKTSQTTLGSGTLVIGGTGGVNPIFQTGLNNANAVQVNANTTGTSIIAANGTGSGFVMSGAINLNSANLNVRTFSAGTTAAVTLSGGVTGTGNLLINNLSNGTAATGKVTLSGATINNIGTVTSQGAGPTANVISAVIGANVTGVIQNSATAGLNLTAVNLYTGNTTITDGTLQISSAGSLNSGNYAGAIAVTAATSTLQYSSSAAQTFSGNITGSGALTKDTGTANTLTLSGTNTYSGATTISAGTLRLGAGGTAGSLSTSSAISVASGSTFSVNQSDIVTQGTDFSGAAISGSGGFMQAGAGTTTLNAANTFGGGVTIKNGTLESKTTTTTLGTGTVTMGGTGSTGATYLTGQNNSNAFVINAPDSGTVAIGANGAGSGFTMSGGISLIGNLTLQTYNNTISGTIKAGSNFTGGITGTGNVLLNNYGLAANTLAITTSAINNVGSLTLQGTATGDTTISANIGSNVTSVTQNSATSRLILSGTNTYTGATTVNSGTLAVNGSLANTSTTVGTGGTLQGSGSMGGSVTVQSGGKIAAGNSIESLATGALSLLAGSTFAYEMNNDAAAGVAGDLTAVTGSMTFDVGNAALLTLTELGTGSWSNGDKLTLLSYSGAWNGGLFNYASSTLADDSTFTFSGMDWAFNYNDTVAGTNYTSDLTGSSFVTMTAVPEPNVAALLGGLGVLALLRRRRN